MNSEGHYLVAIYMYHKPPYIAMIMYVCSGSDDVRFRIVLTLCILY